MFNKPRHGEKRKQGKYREKRFRADCAFTQSGQSQYYEAVELNSLSTRDENR